MKAISHSLTGVIATSFLISTNPIYLSIASIVALLPDCDTSTSTLGRIYPFKFMAKWIEKRYPHRSITHSFLITGLLTLLSSPLILINPILWQTICLSYFVGWFGDVFTKSGVCAFYPSQARLIIPGNPRLRLSTNSPAEYWLISLFIIILISSFYLNNFGSITNFFNSVLALPSGAIEQIKADLSNNLITVNVQGYNNITQEKIDNDYEVIELLTANDFLGKKECERMHNNRMQNAENNNELCTLFYRIGSSQESNIISSKMKVIKTIPITQKSDKITIEDDDIIDYLDYEDNGKTYVSGNLVIEDAEDLIIAKRSDIFNPITVQPAGDGLAFFTLNSVPLNDLKSLLSDYTGSGTIIVRTVELKDPS